MSEFEKEAAQEAAEQDYCTGPTIRISDGQPSDEWKRAAEAMRNSCCNQAPQPDPDRTLYVYRGRDGLTCPIITTKGFTRY